MDEEKREREEVENDNLLQRTKWEELDWAGTAVEEEVVGGVSGGRGGGGMR